MPFQNEHAARVKEPIPSNASFTRRKQIAPGISIVLQRNKGDDENSFKTQSYRFSKNKYTPESAKAWLKEHKIGFISFEPATDQEKEAKPLTQKEQLAKKKEMVERVAKEIGQEIA